MLLTASIDLNISTFKHFVIFFCATFQNHFFNFLGIISIKFYHAIAYPIFIFSYSKVPVRYQLNGKDSVIAANGKLPLSLEEEEHFLSDEDEDEMVYDSDMMIKR